MTRSPTVCLALLVAFTTLNGCDATGDVREWSPDDHEQPASAPGQVTARPAGQNPPPSDDVSLINLAWQRNCQQCHGPRGAGDGPQGPMVKAPDLTRPDWQAKVTDEDIADIIRRGKNKMPKFDLPDQVVMGLVKRVRAARAR